MKTSGGGAVGPQVGFAFDEPGKVIEMGERVLGCGCGQWAAVFGDEGQAEGGESGVELFGVVVGGFHGLGEGGS